LREAIAASGAKLKEDLGRVQRQVKDDLRQSQEREAQAMADVRNEVGRLSVQFQAVVEENGHQVLAVAEMLRTNEQLREEVGGLKLRIEVLEQENRRLSAANEAVKRDIGEVSEYRPKVKRDLANLERKLAKLAEEVRDTSPKAEPLARLAADVTVPPPPESSAIAKPTPDASATPAPPLAARKPSSESSTNSSLSAPSPKPSPVKVSTPPAPPKHAKQFPPLVNKGKIQIQREEIVIPDGIIAHLTRECGGNVHDHHIIDITSGSFEKESRGAHPSSGTFDNNPKWAAQNAADLAIVSFFFSACRDSSEDIPYTRNNWICYNFKERRIVPTHYTIRTNSDPQNGGHMRTWLVETSADGENWREVAYEKDNKQLNGRAFTATFTVASGEECRFIRLVNIGRNHFGNDCLCISAWEIFGTLVE
jgi:hypothetical protein